MNENELLETLRQAGMQDEEIKVLLQKAIQTLEGVPGDENPPAPTQEEEETKMKEVFGI